MGIHFQSIAQDGPGLGARDGTVGLGGCIAMAAEGQAAGGKASHKALHSTNNSPNLISVNEH